MTPARLDLEVPRNGSDARTLQLYGTDNGSEVVLDLTGHTVAVEARDVFGGTVIATATASIIDAAQGMISVTWLGSQFDAYGDNQGVAVAAYDLKLVDGTGQPSVPLRGLLHITPEATA